MKINKLFHWLYAFLMGLPLLSSLWVGLIWTFNENVQVPSITENVSKEYYWNQLYNGNGYTQTTVGGTMQQVENTILINVDTSNNSVYFSPRIGINFDNTHTYLLKSNGDTNCYLYFYLNNSFNPLTGNTITRIEPNQNIDSFLVLADIMGTYELKFNVYDLTLMFGKGNEISTSEFINKFGNYYFDYDSGTHLVYENWSTKQVLDSPVNYIWLPSFGGMGWTIQNVFNQMVSGMFGLATSYGIGLTIVKLLTYWLCISLIWLIYDVIMYVPLMIHRWLDKGVIS